MTLVLAQSETTLGKLKFTPPKDWQVKQADNAVTMSPPGESHLVVLIQEGEPAQGELKAYQEKMWKLICQGAKKITEGQTLAGKTDAGWESLMTERTIDLENGTAYALVFAFRAVDRFECVCVAGDSQATVSKYQEAVAGVLKSLKRAVDSVKFQYYTGFYSGLQVVGNQRDPKLTTTPRYLVLLADGTFLTGFAGEGYDQFDFKTDQANNKSFSGTYTADESMLTLTYAQGTVRRYKKKVETYDLKHVDTAEGFWLEPPVEDLKLEGVYRTPEPKNSPAVAFNADGTFVDEGALGSIGFNLGEDMRKPGRGKYRTANFSMIVKYDDGRARRILLTVGKDQAGEKNPRKIFLGGYIHERQ